MTTLAIQQARAERSRRLDDADDRVLTFRDWCDLNSFSRATGQRIKASGTGPQFIQLSKRRIGVTMRENRAWQAARAR